MRPCGIRVKHQRPQTDTRFVEVGELRKSRVMLARTLFEPLDRLNWRDQQRARLLAQKRIQLIVGDQIYGAAFGIEDEVAHEHTVGADFLAILGRGPHRAGNLLDGVVTGAGYPAVCSTEKEIAAPTARTAGTRRQACELATSSTTAPQMPSTNAAVIV